MDENWTKFVDGQKVDINKREKSPICGQKME